VACDPACPPSPLAGRATGQAHLCTAHPFHSVTFHRPSPSQAPHPGRTEVYAPLQAGKRPSAKPARSVGRTMKRGCGRIKRRIRVGNGVASRHAVVKQFHLVRGPEILALVVPSHRCDLSMMPIRCFPPRRNLEKTFVVHHGTLRRQRPGSGNAQEITRCPSDPAAIVPQRTCRCGPGRSSSSQKSRRPIPGHPTTTWDRGPGGNRSRMAVRQIASGANWGERPLKARHVRTHAESPREALTHRRCPSEFFRPIPVQVLKTFGGGQHLSRILPPQVHPRSLRATGRADMRPPR